MTEQLAHTVTDRRCSLFRVLADARLLEWDGADIDHIALLVDHAMQHLDMLKSCD